ncbi:MAG: LacI family transcriptional regulator, partial [Comamonadaceae bacterium]
MQEAQHKQRRRIKNGSGATISDVSREAGVSTATVSRILNNPEQVSPKTKAVVQSAIEKLGYRPNAAAQSLAARRSYTIGVLVPSISNMLYAIMLDAFKQVIERANYDLMLSSFDYGIDNIRPRVEKFIQRGVDAVFIASVEPDPAVAAILANRDIPFTTTWLADGTAQPRIVYDHLGAAIKPAQHLVELGHRKFALFTGPRTRNRRLRERHDAIAGHLLAKGIAPGDINTIEIPVYDLKHAREAFRNVLDKGGNQTAVIASNDIVA